MLRHVVLRATTKARLSPLRRPLVTSAQKRALNKKQLDGKEDLPEKEAASAAAPTAPSTTSIEVEAASKSTSTAAAAVGGGGGGVGGVGGGGVKPPPVAVPPSGGGGSNTLLIGGGLVAFTGLGLAYYNDMLPFDFKGEEKEKAEETKPEPDHHVTVESIRDTSSSMSHQENRVTVESIAKLGFPPKVDRGPQIVPPVEHIPGGMRVSIQQMNENYMPFKERITAFGKKDEGTPEVVEGKQAREPAKAINVEPESEPKPSPEKESLLVEEQIPLVEPITAEQAAEELRNSTKSRSDSEIRTALLLLKQDLDESYLQDLDSLTTSELKVRIVRLASEMGERARWEAVKQREMMNMKEREVSDKYLNILQKQRLEFEDLLTRRLREQEDAISRQHSTVLKQKEDSIQSVLDAALQAQSQEHKAEIESKSRETELNLSAKYESQFRNQLAEEKKKFAKELEERLKAVEGLMQKMKGLEEKGKVSREFESGSQKAHRMSAAVMALAEKLELGKGAGKELDALKASAGQEGVIATSLSRLPPSTKTGIPTLSQLQARFSHVHSAGRQAAMVPENHPDLFGQLFGMLFATLTLAPSPNDALTADSDSPDILLSRAHRYVEMGDLEEAIRALGKLEGQAKFTVKDWMKEAEERVCVEKVLRVIKLECALLNENMGGAKE